MVAGVMGHAGELTGVALVVALALAGGLALGRLGQPAIVGYILAGVVLGPSGLGFIASFEAVADLAEIGVLLLLFIVGMELSVRAFQTVLGFALAVTALQAVLTTSALVVVALLFGWGLGLGVLLGFVVSLSSTAVAIRMLGDIHEQHSETGRKVIGVLVAQDLAFVPMLLVVTAIGGGGRFWLANLVPVAAGVIVLAVAIWVLARRPVLRLPFRSWASGQRDLTALTGLAWCFIGASVSGLLGLSTAYGAFLAGLVLGNSSDRRALMRAIEPIQGVMLMVFFLSVGLLVDLGAIWRNLGAVLVLLLVVTLCKTVLNVGLFRLMGEPWSHAFLGGTALSQIGEFSFVLAGVGAAGTLIGPEAYRIVVAVIVLSLATSPFWFLTARRLHAMTLESATWREVLIRLYGEDKDRASTWLAALLQRLRRP
jgi:CPA2 family monovalent cation:H+ antiporter-2